VTGVTISMMSRHWCCRMEKEWKNGGVSGVEESTECRRDGTCLLHQFIAIGWVPANVVAEWPKPPQIVEIDRLYEDKGGERKEPCHLVALIQESFFVCSTKHISPTGIELSSPRSYAFVSFVLPPRCRLHEVLPDPGWHFPIRQVSVSALVLFYNWLLESPNRNNHHLINKDPKTVFLWQK